jgi:hypothetical protein
MEFGSFGARKLGANFRLIFLADLLRTLLRRFRHHRRSISGCRERRAIWVLARAFLAKGGALTREGECFLAGLCARHVVDHLAGRGLAVVRVGARTEAAVDLLGPAIAARTGAD